MQFGVCTRYVRPHALPSNPTVPSGGRRLVVPDSARVLLRPAAGHALSDPHPVFCAERSRFKGDFRPVRTKDTIEY